MKESYEVSSLSVAAYCMMNGLELLDVRFEKRRFSGPDKIFVLHDPEEIGPKLSKEYYNSECCRFDDCVKRVRGFLRAIESERRG